jgi:hypothetical protein
MRFVFVLLIATLCVFCDAKIAEETFEGDTNEIDEPRRVSLQNGIINLTKPGERDKKRNFLT